MRRAEYSDRERIIEIISVTFAGNPGVNWLLRKKGNHSRMIRRMAEYSFIKAYNRRGAFISDNGMGAGLCYRFNYNPFSLKEIWYELRFALTCIPLKKYPAVLRRESYRKKQRPASGDYLYFWFLGVLKGGGNAVFEIRDDIFRLAREQNLPIYMETAMERMKSGYERYGFETFHHWEKPSEDICFWFMKWEPGKNTAE